MYSCESAYVSLRVIVYVRFGKFVNVCKYVFHKIRFIVRVYVIFQYDMCYS